MGKALNRRRFGALVAASAAASAAGGCRRRGRPDEPRTSGPVPGGAEVPDREVQVRLDAALGPFRRLSGVQGSPYPIVADDVDHRDRFRACHIEHVRFPQDCPPNTLTLAALFPDEQADPSRPEGYRFEAIDRHVAAAQAAGTKVLWQSSYDVGHSDAWMGLNLGGRPPADLDRWSKVVTRCLEHFNNGWAGGLDRGVESVEFVNEPNGLGGFRGEKLRDLIPAFAAFLETIERYNRAHPKTAVRAVGPGIPFSYPDWSAWRPRFSKLLRELRVAGRRLPVFSFHTYGSDTSPQANARVARALRELLDGEGFRETELWNSEWQGGDHVKKQLAIDARRIAAATPADLRLFGNALAAYALSCKMRWQGLVDRSYYYRANMRALPPDWQAQRLFAKAPGFALLFAPSGELRPLALQERLTHRMASLELQRCRTSWQDDGQLTAMGLRSADGAAAGVLLCSLSPQPYRVVLRLVPAPRMPVKEATAISLCSDRVALDERPLEPPVAQGETLSFTTLLPRLGTQLLLLRST